MACAGNSLSVGPVPRLPITLFRFIFHRLAATARQRCVAKFYPVPYTFQVGQVNPFQNKVMGKQLKQFPVLAFNFILIFLNIPVSANVPDLNEEIRTQNKKIETRLAEWNTRARLDADSMNISKSPR